MQWMTDRLYTMFLSLGGRIQSICGECYIYLFVMYVYELLKCVSDYLQKVFFTVYHNCSSHSGFCVDHRIIKSTVKEDYATVLEFQICIFNECQ